MVIYFQISNLSVLSIAEYQLNSTDIISWLVPGDKWRGIVVETIR